MTDEQINRAIAEACGWEWKPYGDFMAWYRPDGAPIWWRARISKKISDPLPNYCNDLNAMHDAEKVFLKDGSDSELYMDYLMEVVVAAPAGLSNHATARQRAEAFLRTLGKWEEVQA